MGEIFIGTTFVIVLIMVIIAIAVVVPVVQSRHTFVCGNCGKEFKPKWMQLFGDVHVCEEHLIECPFCEVKNMCKDKGRK